MKNIVIICLLSLVALNSVAQICPEGIKQTKPDTQYLITGDNDDLVIDTQTGLMWIRCSLGQMWDGNSCTGTATTYNWQQALNAADTHSFAGFSDWRVPNLKELESLVEPACYSPAINQSIFPNTNSTFYWSSSPTAINTANAWNVIFRFGNNYYSDKNYNAVSVRLVRIGQ
ncbi:MAG: DUF1566 domain-containing protein [Saccharospirillaceae bacterium]|nr:DUF1566 domain-containing protein [Pseudomonadales bacterium]NRB80881.1 DUF1566 domain-containing protein [Saccharospirillaceae bacterium]